MRALRFPLVLLFAALSPLPARALELTRLDDRALKLDVTASTIGAWHADNRNHDRLDDDFGDLINRFNLQLSYWKLVAGLRLDTATYAGLPDEAALARTDLEALGDPYSQQDLHDRQLQYWRQLRSRYRDAYDVGKLWLTYASPNLEVTAGDSYVTFGRGLALSLRKQDELSVDTTLFGGKVVARLPHLSFTGVAGIANPVMVDQTSGQSLYPLAPTSDERALGHDEIRVYGQDRIYGARAEASFLGASLGVHGVGMQRAEPVAANGVRAAEWTGIAGASLSVPFPEQIGSAWLEGAWQRWSGKAADEGQSYALYGSATAGAGPITGLIELQHYRDYWSLEASVDRVNAPEFIGLRYSAPPTTEPLTCDTRYGIFDRNVSGARARLDGRVDESLLFFGTFGRWATWGERVDEEKRNDVTDLSGGAELLFDAGGSRADGAVGLRRDTNAESGDIHYREFHAELSAAKLIHGPWSADVHARHRRRFYEDQSALAWNEDEIYLSLKYSPVLVAALGYEHTSLAGEAPHYFNGTLLWKYRPGSSLKLFAGQQRGALKCVSGVCRLFPPFEGIKLEWTQRY